MGNIAETMPVREGKSKSGAPDALLTGFNIILAKMASLFFVCSSF